MTPETRQKAEDLLQHTFKNPDLLTESLTHASIANTRLVSNERMEFLGDAVLDLVVCEALYLRFPVYLEGDLTKIKSAVVSRKTCAEISIETGLIDLLITGKGISSRDA
ncbi:MAG: ribonuclease, partial [Phycisphaerales bacterium]|nr:ribonuclease [Phycisphaerales bacterium]